MAKQLIVTPTGIAVYPRLNSPDRKFDADGVYKVTVRLPEDKAKSLTDQLDQLFEENLADQLRIQGKKKLKMAPHPWRAVLDDNEDETGQIDIALKMKAKVTTREGKTFEQRPKLFDKHGTPLSITDDIIGGGSLISAAFEPVGYYVAAVGVGLSMRLRAVQVIELVAPGGDAEGYGFDIEERVEEAAEETTTELADLSDF